jgi:SAM-dependent methyltransferase
MRDTKIEKIKWEFGSRRRKGTPQGEFQRKRFVRHLVICGDVKAESKVLSIGCGTCFYELIVRRYTTHLYCLDVSREMLQICKERNFKNLIQASSFYLPFKSDVFDCVYALSLSPMGSGQANMCSRGKTTKEMKWVTKKDRKIVVGHPTTLWKQIDGLLKHGNPNFDTFRVSPSKIRESYKQNGITIHCSMVIPPIPYAILRRVNYLKIDKVLSRLLLGEIGLYLFVCGIK